MPGTVLGTSAYINSFNPYNEQPYEAGTIVSPILQMTKLRSHRMDWGLGTGQAV